MLMQTHFRAACLTVEELQIRYRRVHFIQSSGPSQADDQAKLRCLAASGRLCAEAKREKPLLYADLGPSSCCSDEDIILSKIDGCCGLQRELLLERMLPGHHQV